MNTPGSMTVVLGLGGGDVAMCVLLGALLGAFAIVHFDVPAFVRQTKVLGAALDRYSLARRFRKSPTDDGPGDSVTSRASSRRLAIVVLYYNPSCSAEAEREYKLLVQHLGSWPIELFAVEVSFPGQAFPSTSAFIQLQATEQNLLRQEERLLNMAIERLPAHFDSVAWVAPGTIFLNDAWAEQTKHLLDEYPAVQLCTDIFAVDDEGYVTARLRCVAAQGSVATAGSKLAPYGAGSWAMRRELFPLYDRLVCGPGQMLAYEAWKNGRSVEAQELLSGKALDLFSEWAAEARQKTGGLVGCLPGASLQKSSAIEASRTGINSRRESYSYDPLVDITVDSNGLLAWSPNAQPALQRNVAGRARGMAEQVSKGAAAGDR